MIETSLRTNAILLIVFLVIIVATVSGFNFFWSHTGSVAQATTTATVSIERTYTSLATSLTTTTTTTTATVTTTTKASCGVCTYAIFATESRDDGQVVVYAPFLTSQNQSVEGISVNVTITFAPEPNDTPQTVFYTGILNTDWNGVIFLDLLLPCGVIPVGQPYLGVAYVEPVSPGHYTDLNAPEAGNYTTFSAAAPSECRP